MQTIIYDTKTQNKIVRPLAGNSDGNYILTAIMERKMVVVGGFQPTKSRKLAAYIRVRLQQYREYV